MPLVLGGGFGFGLSEGSWVGGRFWWTTAAVETLCYHCFYRLQTETTMSQTHWTKTRAVSQQHASYQFCFERVVAVCWLRLVATGASYLHKTSTVFIIINFENVRKTATNATGDCPSPTHSRQQDDFRNIRRHFYNRPQTLHFDLQEQHLKMSLNHPDEKKNWISKILYSAHKFCSFCSRSQISLWNT